MYCLTELIYTACFLQAVAGCEECRKVTGEACGFAGNIYNMVHTVGENFGQSLGMDAVTRRVENDHIRFLCEVIENLQHVSCNEFTVGKTV